MILSHSNTPFGRRVGRHDVVLSAVYRGQNVAAPEIAKDCKPFRYAVWPPWPPTRRLAAGRVTLVRYSIAVTLGAFLGGGGGLLVIY